MRILKKFKSTEYAEYKKGRHHILFPCLTIISALLLFMFIQKCTNDFQELFSEETQGYMLEIAQQVTLTINDRVSANTQNAQTIADSLAGMQKTERPQMELLLENIATRYGYTSLILANLEGMAVTNTGEAVNVSRREHYLRARQGESAISGVVRSDYSNTDSIECAIPVLKGEEITGVLIAGYNLRDFEDILRVSIFGGHGKISVIDSQGVYIIHDEQKDIYNFNRFVQELITEEEYVHFTSELEERKSGTLQYSDGTDILITYYQPLGINDWYLLVSTSTEQITSKTNLFLQGMTYVGLATAVVIMLFMLMVLLSQRRNRRQLEYLLYRDPITEGISFVKLEMEAKKRIAEKKPGSYVIIQYNMEHFKLINTSFGRDAGNRTLRYIYRSIQAHLRADELVARTTADRFCLLLRYYSPEETTARLKQIGEDINLYNENRKGKYLLSFDAGACVVDSASADITMLYERANFSRTHGGAIHSKPGALAFYDEVERSVVVREKEIENRMEEALLYGEFEAYLQPKYELEKDRIAGAEALVRWRDPQRGLISPGEFIPLFERNGFIVKLDLFVFEQICILLQRRWEGEESCVPISVNLSRRHLESPRFLENYRKIYARYTFPSHLIEIELTESIVFNNMQLLCQVIDEIHQVGFECSMDDFGSGYSSLNMLKDIPVDTLKLDRAFFYSNSTDVTKSRHVVSSIIDLARKLDMKTVSEGIETLEQVEFLRRAQCNMVQGYVFAKPMPIEQFEDLMKTERISEENLL